MMIRLRLLRLGEAGWRREQGGRGSYGDFRSVRFDRLMRYGSSVDTGQ